MFQRPDFGSGITRRISLRLSQTDRTAGPYWPYDQGKFLNDFTTGQPKIGGLRASVRVVFSQDWLEIADV